VRATDSDAAFQFKAKETNRLARRGDRLAFEANKTLEGNWEYEANALNIFPRASPNQFIGREGEAPAEPWRL
jgi:hypothetical protein